MWEYKDKQVLTDHAIRSFPKFSNRDLLPTHLENFTDLMDSCGIAEDARTCRFPEVLTGQLALALQNLKLSADTPFPKAMQQLLRAVSFTTASAARTFLRPDTDVLKVMGPADLMNHVESLVTRLISGVTAMEDVKLKWLLAFMNNVGSQQCVSALATKEIMSRADLQDAVIAVFDNHGSIVDDEKNVSKFFSSLLKKREPSNHFKPSESRLPTCFKCGKLGHKVPDCFSAAGAQQKPEKLTTCFSCGQTGYISPNCPSKANLTVSRDEKLDKDRKPSKKSNRVSLQIEDDKLTIMASVGDITFPAIVTAVSRINEKVIINGYDGKSEVREMAEVRIKIGRKCCT